MSDEKTFSPNTDVHSLIKTVLEEVMSTQQKQAEPAYKRELNEEKSRREQLEKRLNELIEENRRAKATTEALEQEAKIKAELQKQGVSKLDLAYRAVKDDVHRNSDGLLTVRNSEGQIPLRQYLQSFLDENPELLPARNIAGSGSQNSIRTKASGATIDLDAIHPGMSKEDMARARLEIARIATQITE